MSGIEGKTLREWRRSLGWDVPKTARELRRVASEPVAAPDALVRMIRGWERGEHELSERYELVMTTASQVAGIQIILEQPTARVGRDDHPDNRQFFLAELADLAGRVSHNKLSVFAEGTSWIGPLDHGR